MYVANDEDAWASPDGWKRAPNIYVFRFGAYGDTVILARGKGLEDALESAAEQLRKVNPDFFTEPDYKAAAEELGDEASEDQIREHAEVDLTYTESGWICSWEWHVVPVCIQNG